MWWVDHLTHPLTPSYFAKRRGGRTDTSLSDPGTALAQTTRPAGQLSPSRSLAAWNPPSPATFSSWMSFFKRGTTQPGSFMFILGFFLVFFKALNH